MAICKPDDEIEYRRQELALEDAEDLYRETFLDEYSADFGHEYINSHIHDLTVSILGTEAEQIFSVSAWQGNRLGGSIFSREVDGYVYLWGLYIRPALQRKGIGRSLLLKASERYVNDCILEVHVLSHKAKALGFYRKCGFSIVESHEAEIFPSLTSEVVMMQCPVRDLIR